MSALRRFVPFLFCALLAVPGVAQDATEPNTHADEEKGMASLDGSRLTADTLRYETTVRMGQQSTTRPTVRTFSKGLHEGTPVWRVVDAVEGASQADTLFLDRTSLRPLQRRVGGQAALTLTFDSTSVSGAVRARGQTRSIKQAFDQPVLASTANMEVGLATLSLESGFVVRLPVFHLQQQTVTPTTLRVTGTDTVAVPAGSFEAFVLETTSQGPGPSGTYYVRRAAPHHVIKADLTGKGPRGQAVTATKQLTSMSGEASAGSK
jgi:hypothetical protein